MTQVDYETLLRKYIQHVADCEGTDFLSRYYIQGSSFTEQERRELLRLANEGVV